MFTSYTRDRPDSDDNSERIRTSRQGVAFYWLVSIVQIGVVAGLLRLPRSFIVIEFFKTVEYGIPVMALPVVREIKIRTVQRHKERY